ncbi:MAG: hypothetical protein LUD07_06900 [Clostridiales bacterium]|nr:hypothetical protein [Clostridiales bacterium]
MDQKILGSAQREKLFHSREAVDGARRLMERIEIDDMAMEILPNNFTQFTGELEENEYLSYCRFLSSANGQKVIQMLEVLDERELFEL